MLNYIVELEKGVWLADGTIGDPPRTLKRENARVFKQRNWAKIGLKEARQYRPFPKGKVVIK